MTSTPSTRRQLDGVASWSGTAGSGQHGGVLAERGLGAEFSCAPDSLFEFPTGRCRRRSRRRTRRGSQRLGLRRTRLRTLRGSHRLGLRRGHRRRPPSCRAARRRALSSTRRQGLHLDQLPGPQQILRPDRRPCRLPRRAHALRLGQRRNRRRRRPGGLHRGPRRFRRPCRRGRRHPRRCRLRRSGPRRGRRRARPLLRRRRLRRCLEVRHSGRRPDLRRGLLQRLRRGQRRRPPRQSRWSSRLHRR